MSPRRGTFAFETTATGDLVDSETNTDALHRLWLDRSLIDGDALGPGDAGDFDYGAWHVACHVVAGGGVRRRPDGSLLWLEISHDPGPDQYFAAVTARDGARTNTDRVEDPTARRLLAGSALLGFVEGNSLGRISARGADDPPDRFNSWRRQQFNQPVNSGRDGGKVWEHWCTVRDIRPTQAIGMSVLRAYVALVAALGDTFAPTVARGRRDYGHPKQVCALVRSGFTAEASALCDITPMAILDEIEPLFLEARPADALTAAERLQWGSSPRYYMFKRRISHWSDAAKVRDDLRRFPR